MELLSPKLNRWLFYLIVISLSISPAFATDPIDNRNYFLIGCMFLGPIIIIFSNKFIPKVDVPIAIIISLMFAFQGLFNNGTVRWSSMLFSCMFYTYFAAAVRVFNRANMKVNCLLTLIRRLIYAYAIVLLIQQFCVLFGLPVFNQMWSFGEHNPWKLNSLSAEPSHTARYVGVLMYCYLIISDKISGRKQSFAKSFINNKLLWISFLWVMITMLSGTAMIILLLIFCTFIKKRSFIPIAGVIMVIFSIGLTSEYVQLYRAANFLQSVTSGDTKAMISADHSASIRVVPMILCVQRIDPHSVSGWVGTGTGSSAAWMSKKMPGVPLGWSGGGIANYILEYGLIIGAIFILVSLNWCFDPKNALTTIGLWVMCIFMIGVNTQIGWLCILMLYISKRIRIGNADKSILQFT